MSNLNQTTETAKPTLKINTTVTVHDVVEMEVELPYFCKSKDDTYYKVISRDSALRVVFQEFGRLSPVVLIMQGSTSIWQKDIAESVQVSETEFHLAVSLALDHIQKAVA